MKKYAEINDEGIVINTVISSEANIQFLTGTFIEYDVLLNPARRDAVIGSTYDKINDRFIDPKPYESWQLNENGSWEPPVERPLGPHMWDEDSASWVALDSIEFELP